MTVRRVLRSFWLVSFLAIPTVSPTLVSAQVPAETEARLRSIFEARDFDARSFQASWLPDGSGYATLETPAGPSQRELIRYAAASGARTVLASLSNLTPSGASEPLSISSFQFAPDGSWVLVQTSGDGFWMFDLVTSALRKVDGGGGNTISPGGNRILFSRDGDLHVHDLSAEQTTRLTWTTAESFSNGRAVWSPDGNRIAFVQSDASGVRMRSMLVPTDPSYPEIRQVRFARVGETIAKLRVGVVDAQGREVRWISVPSPNEGFYLGQVSWAGNSEDLLVEQFSRFRDERDFYIANVTTGEVDRIYHESDPAWVIASYRLNAGLEWIRGGDSFLFLTEKDGWRHAYVYSREGREERLLTPGASDVMERGPVDHGNGWSYYFASPDNATQRYLYRVRLDGSEAPERVSPEGQPGTHSYDFSPDLRWALHTYSNFDTPPVTSLISLPEHRVVRVLQDNAEVRRRAEATTTHPTEFLQLDIGDGVVMDAWMIKPRDFDPSRKYPVFIYVYGEPHAQTVLDRWSTRNNYHRAIADLGYLVVSIENRGTPAPKGAEWRRAPFPTIGVQSTEEHAAGVLELGRILPYVDLSRVGIWGWSGGGSNTLNSLFRRPDVYHVGIAVVPKPQPHLYNAWFQEIYMETVETNPEGYRVSAPINYAEGLEGDLLIIHGTGETNTHLEIVEGLVDRLVELGKTFDYTAYPNRNHGLSEGAGTVVHVRMLMVRYLLDHLPPGQM
ncbi:MAG: prolyl oligopeptidase family serine peptidase [Gemmatimonadetes bacterium]|nr:prolyl oligopeptidase family serine peptidase [Gemmatimonadota bacterium]MYE18008.1 prolyl oligopeptidase family serine peptidase [Gemmatimonadota bacterium]MYG21641.1 prolyl oligopeptidase family serine peptidase [Gemmatimonadota bacterium]MYJ37877.1 prolyl oligopeptidase family serine peptidase [Gemmatimonadota bacterium]